MKMHIKHYKGAQNCQLTVKFRVPVEWIEQLTILIDYFKMKSLDRYVKRLLQEQIDAKKNTIARLLARNKHQDKQYEEYIKHKYGERELKKYLESKRKLRSL